MRDVRVPQDERDRVVRVVRVDMEVQVVLEVRVCAETAKDENLHILVLRVARVLRAARVVRDDRALRGAQVLRVNQERRVHFR